MDDASPAADGAILDILLARPRRRINRDHDLLTASIADVAGFVVHLLLHSLDYADLSSGGNDPCKFKSSLAEQRPVLVFDSSETSSIDHLRHIILVQQC